MNNGICIYQVINFIVILLLFRKSPSDILKDVLERLRPTNDTTNDTINGSSFGMFLRLLGKKENDSFLSITFWIAIFAGNFIKKGHQTDPKFWPQLQGRIYSRFTKNKVAELNENGLYNFICLFLTLATTADCQNAVFFYTKPLSLFLL